MELEQLELLKPQKRTLSPPIGGKRFVVMEDLYWRWYDRYVAYEWSLSETEFLASTVELSEAEDKPFDEVLRWWIEYQIKWWAERGIDVTETDADLRIKAGKDAVMRFRKRNPPVGD